MPFSSSDSSSSSEDEDDLMSFRPFSPSISSSSSKTKKSGKENRCRNETAGDRNGGGKNDGGCSQSSEDDEEDIDEVVARRRAEKVVVPRLVASPSQLMWYRRKRNQREIYHPCCVCEGGIDDDESSEDDSDGGEDESSSLRIRLISRQSFGNRITVPRDSLVPYHGGEHGGDKEARWNRRILGTYPDDAKPKGERLDGSTLMVEALYLEKVLRVASERSSSNKTASVSASPHKPQNRTQQSDGSEDDGSISSGDRREPKSKTTSGVGRSKPQSRIQKEDREKERRTKSKKVLQERKGGKKASAGRQNVIQQEEDSEGESSTASEVPSKPQSVTLDDASSSEDDEDEDDYMATCDMEVPYTQDLRLDSDDEMDGFRLESSSNEPVRPGDVVEYYSQMFVTGDKRGLRTATVLSVDPDREPMLVIDNGEFLPPDTQIRRVKTMLGGTLQDHLGIYRSIETFKLTKNVPEGAGVAAGIRKESERVGRVIQKNVVRFKEKAKASGFAPLDILNKYKCVDEAQTRIPRQVGPPKAKNVPQNKEHRVRIDAIESSHRRKLDSDSSSSSSSPDDDSLGWSAEAKANSEEGKDQEEDNSNAASYGGKRSLSRSSSSDNDSDKDQNVARARTASRREGARPACTTPSNTFGSMQLGSSRSSSDDDMDITPRVPGRGRSSKSLPASSRKLSPKRKSPAVMAASRRNTKSGKGGVMSLSDSSASSDDHASRQKQRKIATLTPPTSVEKTPVGRTRHYRKKTPTTMKGRTPPSATSTLSFEFGSSNDDDDDFERPVRSPIPFSSVPRISGAALTPQPRPRSRKEDEVSKGGRRNSGSKKITSKSSPKPRGGGKLEAPLDSSSDSDFERPVTKSPIPCSGKGKVSRRGKSSSQKKGPERSLRSKKSRSRSPKPRTLEKPELDIFTITRRK